MGFDKNRRPLWLPGLRDRLNVLSSTAVNIPPYGVNTFAASTKAGEKKFILSNPIGAGTEVKILGTGLLTGAAATRNVVTASSKTFFIDGTTKNYRKAVFTQGGKRGGVLQVITISTANYFIISKTTSVAFSTGTT